MDILDSYQHFSVRYPSSIDHSGKWRIFNNHVPSLWIHQPCSIAKGILLCQVSYFPVHFTWSGVPCATRGTVMYSTEGIEEPFCSSKASGAWTLEDLPAKIWDFTWIDQQKLGFHRQKWWFHRSKVEVQPPRMEINQQQFGFDQQKWWISQQN